MIRFESLRDVDAPQWDRWMEDCPEAGVYHSSAWLRFLESTQGGEIAHARIVENGSVLGYFCGRIVRKYGLRILGSPLPGWTTHYMGPVLIAGAARSPGVLQALDHWVFQELRCEHFEFLWRGAEPGALRDFGYGEESLPSFLLDLRAEPEQIFRRFNKGCKWSVHKAEREGVSVEESSESSFVQDYYEQLQDVFAKQSLVPTYPRSRVEQLFRCVGPENLVAMRALTPQGECAATVIATRDKRCGYLWGAASWRHHQKLLPNELLQWRLMLRLKELGMVEYDFGGGGAYKAKYGGAPISTPWFFRSRNPAVRGLRAAYRGVFRARQRLQGWFRPGGTSKKPEGLPRG